MFIDKPTQVDNLELKSHLLSRCLQRIKTNKPDWDTKRNAIEYQDVDAQWHRGMLTGWALLAALRKDGVIASSVEKDGAWVAPKRAGGKFWANNTLLIHPIEAQSRWLLPQLKSVIETKNIEALDGLFLAGKNEKEQQEKLIHDFPNLFLPFVAGFRGLKADTSIDNGGDLILPGVGEGPCLRTRLENLTHETQTVLRQLLGIDILKLHEGLGS